jgi:hypothetical protein
MNSSLLYFIMKHFTPMFALHRTLLDTQKPYRICKIQDCIGIVYSSYLKIANYKLESLKQIRFYKEIRNIFVGSNIYILFADEVRIFALDLKHITHFKAVIPKEKEETFYIVDSILCLVYKDRIVFLEKERRTENYIKAEGICLYQDQIYLKTKDNIVIYHKMREKYIFKILADGQIEENKTNSKEIENIRFLQQNGLFKMPSSNEITHKDYKCSLNYNNIVLYRSNQIIKVLRYKNTEERLKYKIAREEDTQNSYASADQNTSISLTWKINENHIEFFRKKLCFIQKFKENILAVKKVENSLIVEFQKEYKYFLIREDQISHCYRVESKGNSRYRHILIKIFTETAHDSQQHENVEILQNNHLIFYKKAINNSYLKENIIKLNSNPMKILKHKECTIVSLKDLSFIVVHNGTIKYRDSLLINITAMTIFNSSLVVGSDDRYIRIYNISHMQYDRPVAEISVDLVCSFYVNDVPIGFECDKYLIYFCREGKVGQFKIINQSFSILVKLNKEYFAHKKGQFGIIDQDCVVDNFTRSNKEESGNENDKVLCNAIRNLCRNNHLF